MVYQKMYPGVPKNVEPSNYRLAHNPSSFLAQMLINWVKKNI